MTINAKIPSETVSVAFAKFTGNSVNKQDAYLLAAAKEGNVEKLRNALASGANVNVKDDRGYTPLMILVDIGSVEGVGELINRGADLKAQSFAEGFTALMIAANSAASNGGDGEIFSALLKADPSDEHINCASFSGVTALMLALDAGKNEISLKLKKAKADVNKVNEHGLSALTYAVTNKHADTVSFLIKQKFPLSKNQVWEAIGIALNTDISILLELWLAIEKHPENFVDSSEDPVIPAAVQIFKNPTAFALESGVNFSHQDRSANPALALKRPASPAAAIERLQNTVHKPEQGSDDGHFDPSGIPVKRALGPLSDEKQSDAEVFPSSVAQRQRVSEGASEQDDADNRRVQLSASVGTDFSSGAIP